MGLEKKLNEFVLRRQRGLCGCQRKDFGQCGGSNPRAMASLSFRAVALRETRSNA
jgi:hypothetical protein